MKDISKCICGSQNIYTTDSRKIRGSIRRRKKCADCGRAFVTYEVEADTYENYLKFVNSFSGVKMCVDLIDRSLTDKN